MKVKKDHILKVRMPVQYLKEIWDHLKEKSKQSDLEMERFELFNCELERQLKTNIEKLELTN